MTAPGAAHKQSSHASKRGGVVSHEKLCYGADVFHEVIIMVFMVFTAGYVIMHPFGGLRSTWCTEAQTRLHPQAEQK